VAVSCHAVADDTSAPTATVTSRDSNCIYHGAGGRKFRGGVGEYCHDQSTVHEGVSWLPSKKSSHDASPGA